MRVIEEYPGELRIRGPYIVKALREQVAQAQHHHAPLPAVQQALARSEEVFRDQVGRMIGDVVKVLRRQER